MNRWAGMALLAVIVSAAAQLATGGAIAETLSVVPAPVPPDGYYAGTATHVVFILVPNPDPAVNGIGLQKGDTLAIMLPKEFERDDKVAVREDSDFNLTLTKGWPQAPVRQSGQYKIFFDPKTNAVGVRAETDIGADGANRPGAKMIHLRGGTFLNPAAGAYQVEVRLADDGGKLKKSWSGVYNVAAGPMAGRVAPTNFHLGPNENADFQQIGRNQDAPKLLAILLWDSAGKPKNGVAIALKDASRFPNYDQRLVDAASGAVIGGVILSPPAGATGQKASSLLGPGGRPLLSGAVVRSAKFPEKAGGGKPNPGLLPIVFHAGDKPGQYRLKIEMIGGNSTQYTFNVK